MKIVLASANAHKALELCRVLEGWEVETFDGELPEETGETFIANARLKARHQQNLAKLIGALADENDRRVRYVAELVAIAPDGAEVTARGELAGTLVDTPRGTGGFGYDPAFVPDGETRTVAEMAAVEKDAISHRARAARTLLPLLKN